MPQVQKARTIRMDDDTWLEAGRLASRTGEAGVSVSELLRNLILAERDCRRRDSHKGMHGGAVVLGKRES